MTYENIETISTLKEGDIVRNKGSHRTFIVTANYGTRVTAVMTADITNAGEWEILNVKEKKK